MVLYIVGKDNLVLLKEKYDGLGNVSIKDITTHLRDNSAIRMLDQNKKS